ncbi:hypothetical protein MBAV_001457 [Candidatus Magnetobacterium bavaricum]|uniref:Uncharacterized protein n=1 Tax=Candidatus Magnetobacterium bavaricum TaxID=29290 RepID=A0A0F3GWK9_9BACT|nr:hypothetical protein MBAV_001457 [Candidatus Magnetobacterium bavaricum]
MTPVVARPGWSGTYRRKMPFTVIAVKTGRHFQKPHIADLDWIKYKIRGIFTGSRGPCSLVGGSEGGQSPPFFLCIARNRNAL